MRRKTLFPLIALNAGLLAALVAVTFMPSAFAQLRPRSTYTMTGGTVNGIVQGVVYITNETTNELVAVSWYENQKRLVGLGYRNMSADAAQFGRTR
jgi:hypothetical protein